MATRKLTKEQLFAIKQYYKNLYETHNDTLSGISIDNLDLFIHPYDEEKVYIRYTCMERKNEGVVPRIVSVCVNKKGKVGDCFTKSASLEERITFEKDLHRLDLKDKNIKVV